jgi:hypothetical protein
MQVIPKMTARNIPFEHGILLEEFVEVGHELVYRFSHVHVPNFCPNSVEVRQRGGLVFISSDGRLKFVSATWLEGESSERGHTHVYLLPS